MACVITTCKSRMGNKENESEKVSFHRFPVDATLRDQWIAAVATGKVEPDGCTTQGWTPRKHHRVCSKHFVAEFFSHDGKRRRLKDNAVPTLYLSRCCKPTKSLVPDEGSIASTSSVDLECPSQDTFTPVLSSSQPISANPSIVERDNAIAKLEKEVRRLKMIAQRRLLTINLLKQRTRRLKKKTQCINIKLIDILEKENVQKENLIMLECVKNNKVIERYLSQAKGDKPREYSVELKKFAVTLNFLSPRAYNFVRDELQYALPHPKTIAKWYQGLNCDPGFTQEAMDAIKERVVQNDGKPLYGALSIDEMAIRKLVEWDGLRYFGYANVGCALNSDDVPLTKEALTFMLTSVNDTWKIAIGYFLLHAITSEQKALLVEQCLTLLRETGVQVVTLTFDGAATNMAMCEHLGCNIKSADANSITFEGQEICLWPDPCHNIKLIRNAFADRKVLIDGMGRKISWHFIEMLNKLQNEEGLHLGNKLKDDHVNFIRQKIKVRLATQLLSQSVADALRFCKEVGIPGFEDCEGTIQFITIFNNLFDILNSRNMRAKAWKKALTSFNVEEVELFFHAADIYINGLKFQDDYKTVVNSNRYTGFCGFKTCMKSLLQLYKSLVKESGELQYICTYKFSQDHIELFFGAIRSLGGFNNNPSARMFRAAYKKLLVHAQFKDGANGNCVPLENIKMLNYSMDFKKQINDSTGNTRLTAAADAEVSDFFSDIPLLRENDHDHEYITHPSSLTEYSRHAVHYIAGFVVKKLMTDLKCERCLQSLEDNSISGISLLSIKDRGGLIKPALAVTKTCQIAEKVFREYSLRIGSKKIGEQKNILKMINKVSASLPASFDFNHTFENGIFEDHRHLLIKCISKMYFKIRVHHVTKKIANPVDKIRSHFNKTILFKGQ